MDYYALVFLVFSLIVGALGVGAIAGTSAGVASALAYLFIAMLVISVVDGHFRRKI